jgi:hypothetical protein
MMLSNLPDIGFCNSQNIYQPDRNYQNIKDSVLKCVAYQNNVYKIEIKGSEHISKKGSAALASLITAGTTS